MAELHQLAGDTVPVEVGLHRTTPGRAQPGAQCRVVEQPCDGPRHRLRALGVHQQAGLAVAHGGRNPAAPTGHHRNAACGCFGQRDPESFHPLLHQPRNPEIDLGTVVQRRKIAVGNAGEKPHPVGHAERPGLVLQRGLLLAGTDHRVPQVWIPRRERGEGPERGVDPLVPGEPCDREQPAAAVQSVALANFPCLEPGPEELVIRTERHDPHALGRRVELELAQEGKAAVAGPFAVGYQHRGRSEQRGGGGPLERRLMNLMLQDEQITAVQQDPERRPDALAGPLGRVRGGLDVAAPDELGAVGARQHGGPARPEQDPLDGAEPPGRDREAVHRVGEGCVHVGGVRMQAGGDHQRPGRVPPGQLRHPPRDAAADRGEVVREEELRRHPHNLVSGPPVRRARARSRPPCG